MKEDKLLIPKTEDLFRMCDRYAEPRFSPFLDGGEIARIEDELSVPYGYNVKWYGGAKSCERKMLGVFPEWEEPSEDAFPIKAVCFEGSYSDSLTHRDYLGTIMSLGIDRNKTGDIIVSGNRAYVFANADIADYISESITKIGNRGVKSKVVSPVGLEVPEPELEEMRAVCASARLDAVVAAAANVSRANASALINGEKVKLNHREVSNTSKTVKDGDLISIRGCGRFVFKETGMETRKGRIHIKLYRYI